MIVLTYVDDNLCIGTKAARERCLCEVQHHGLGITTDDTLSDYLSCEIVFNSDKTKAWIRQPHMIK